MRKFALYIISPEGLIFEGEVDMVIVPGSQGELGILAGHTPLLSSLKGGKIRLRQGSRQLTYRTGGGFIEVADGVRILVREVRGKEI